jgi:hypothetical protein
MAAMASSSNQGALDVSNLSVTDEALSALGQDAFIAVAGFFGLPEMFASLRVSHAWRHQASPSILYL